MTTKDQPSRAEITPGRDRPVFVAHQHLHAADTRAPHPATHDHLVLAFCLGHIPAPLERRCLDPISLQDVADAVHRSPAHVTTLVRRATRRPVQAWIIAGRLAEATRRLRHTDEIVDVIAERVGYADATHFIRLFRREHGITPAAWRSRQRSAG